ncbi:MAG: universal stress protein [Chloroflexi bacterium]|nr:universal stress protein [Chloroflexota bacterium]
MKKHSKILVSLEGNESDDDVVRLACQIARQDKASVIAIYVIEVQRHLPLDAENAPQLERADNVLKHAEEIAKDCGHRIETELLQARVAGSVIVNEAVDRGVDLIILGMPYRKPLGDDVQLGATARYVLLNAACAVWLCRGPAADAPASGTRAR